MDKITITREEYEQLKHDAACYRKIASNNASAGRISAAKLTPEERKARAKKAVEARIAKYRQKKHVR